MDLEYELRLAAPPGRLWARLADLAAWPSWAKGVVAVALKRGVGTARGDLFRVEIEHKGYRTCLEGEVTQTEQDALHAHRMWNEQVEVTTTTRLAPDGDGTRLRQTLEITLHGFTVRLLASKIRKELKAKQAADLAALGN